MDTRNIIDYAFDDNAKEMRESLYASIYDRVTAAFEAKKQELAHNLVGMPMSTESVEMELDESPDLSIHALYNTYADRLGDEANSKPIEKLITKVHGAQVLHHIKKSAAADEVGNAKMAAHHYFAAEKLTGKPEHKFIGKNRVANMHKEEHLDEEQLDELSPQTLGSYVKKASQDINDKSTKAGDALVKSHGNYALNKKLSVTRYDASKADQAKRVGGIATAVGKMMNQKIKS